MEGDRIEAAEKEVQETWGWRACTGKGFTNHPAASDLSNCSFPSASFADRASPPIFLGIVPWKMPNWLKTFWTHRFGELGAVV